MKPFPVGLLPIRNSPRGTLVLPESVFFLPLESISLVYEAFPESEEVVTSD